MIPNFVFSKTPKRIIGFLFILVWLVWSVQCHQPNSDEQLKIIVESNPNCTVPCWNNIFLGESNENDFLVLVNQSPKQMFSDLKWSETSYQNSVSYSWEDRTSSLIVSTSIDNSQISFLSFRGFNQLTFETVLTVLGDPDSYTAEVYHGEANSFVMNLFYEKRGVVIHIFIVPFEQSQALFSKPTCQINIDKNMLVRNIYLVKPDSAIEMLKPLKPYLSSDGMPKLWLNTDLLSVTYCR